MRKVWVFVLITLALLLGISACSFKQVKDINLSFYDGEKLLGETTLYRYNNGGFDSPQSEGKDFLGWYLDAECTQKADFSGITHDTVLYAGWRSQRLDTIYYVVTICNENKEIIKTTGADSVENIVFPEPPAKEGYVFKEWANLPEVLTRDVVVYASYLKKCRIVFYVNKEDTTPWSTKEILQGETVSLPQNPTKAADAQYVYTFTGWSESFENVTDDLNVYAVFSHKTNSYAYKFIGDNGKVLKSKTAEYGTTVNPPTATKAADESFAYTFDGWDLDADGVADEVPSKVNGEFTAVALFTSIPRTFDVGFYSEGVLLYTDTVSYQMAAEYSGDNPTKQADEQFTYTFSGWDADFSFVETELTINAVFTSELRSYTYVFNDINGEALRVTAAYGSIIEEPQPTGQASTAEYDYVFDGWQGGYTQGMLLSGDCTFTAKYSPVRRTYTYTFYFGIHVVSTETAEYGSVIVAPEPPLREGYEFVGWSGGYTEGMQLYKNEEFTAVYRK